MNYKPQGRAGFVIAIIEGIGSLISAGVKWIWKKIRKKNNPTSS